MPNWAYNTLAVTGDITEIKKFLNGLNESVSYITWQEEWFTSILHTYYPCPEELYEVTSPVSIISNVEIEKDRLIADFRKRGSITIRDKDNEETISTLTDHIPIRWERDFDEYFNIYWKEWRKGYITHQESKILVDKYGFNNWYDWCHENWSTKWRDTRGRFITSMKLPSESIFISEDGINCEALSIGEFTYQFETAWSPPVNGIAEIAKQFPTLHFILQTTEESSAYVYRGEWKLGDLIQEVSKDPSEAYEKQMKKLGITQEALDEDPDLYDQIVIDVDELLDKDWITD